MRETSLSKDRGVAAGRDFEKNRSCVLPRGIVDAAAGRLLADNYVDLVFDGRKATLRALLGAFPVDAPEQDPELALAFATGRLYDGLLDEISMALSSQRLRRTNGGRTWWGRQKLRAAAAQALLAPATISAA